MVWQSGHKVVAWQRRSSWFCQHSHRCHARVTGLSCATVVAVATGKQALELRCVAGCPRVLSCGLNSVLCRLIDYCDILFADTFTLHVSTRIMEHASNLDLATKRIPPFTTSWSGLVPNPLTGSI